MCFYQPILTFAINIVLDFIFFDICRVITNEPLSHIQTTTIIIFSTIVTSILFDNLFSYKFKYGYLKKYIDYTYHVKYDSDREKIQESIIDKYFVDKTPQRQNKLIFTAGCYGAGKSNVMKQLHKLGKINLDEYVIADQDKMRTYLPEYEGYLRENHFTAGFKTNKETCYMSELVQRHALCNGYNLIIDSSLRDGNWHLNYINWIKQTYPNYDIIIIFVAASWTRILERNIKRGEITRRVIPLECLANAFKQSPISFKLLKNNVDKHYYVFNDGVYKSEEDESDDVIEQLKLIEI